MIILKLKRDDLDKAVAKEISFKLYEDITLSELLLEMTNFIKALGYSVKDSETLQLIDENENSFNNEPLDLKYKIGD